ncbi:MAG TPA: FGGY family carbohydrate kinase [Chitinophagales bacterium]|nr:FGGY family carbohydrate kinase [Chitinophagales bacterium]
MNKIPVIAIFDVGKTNKKLLLFDQQYNMIYEESKKLQETKDEDGFACEDVTSLTDWVKNSFSKVLSDERFDVKAVNFSAYGASFVYLDDKGEVILPLYNYLKPYPKKLQDQFYKTYGGESVVAKQTASPVLGSLNSGLQLYRLKYEKPEMFEKIRHALHLPQYLSYILCSGLNSDITSIGCHTNLWHFLQSNYHQWVKQEGLLEKFPPLLPCTKVAAHIQNTIAVGAGLHDSSAALIPYLSSFREPFILLSTGTWCISLNPFNQSPLSDYELEHDCLCYLSYEGKPVKASRLFAGYEHEQQVKRLAEHFNKPLDYYTTVSGDAQLLRKTKQSTKQIQKNEPSVMIGPSAFAKRELTGFKHYEEAYHQLIADLILQQTRSTNLVLKGTPVKKIFVDGGFANNSIYMQLLAASFPEIEIYAASVAQATAMGAALAIHKEWNPLAFPSELVKLKQYKAGDILDTVA